jgi:hypothetical protein
MKKKEEIDNVYEKKAQEERAAIMKTKEKKEKRTEPKESRTQPMTATETDVKESPNFDEVPSKPEMSNEEAVSEKKRLEKNSRANPFEEDEEEFEFDIFGDRAEPVSNKTSQPEKKKQNIDLDSSDDEEESKRDNNEKKVNNSDKSNHSEKEAKVNEEEVEEEDFFGDDFDTEKMEVIKTQIDDIPDSPEIEEDTDQQETCPQE